MTESSVHKNKRQLLQEAVTESKELVKARIAAYELFKKRVGVLFDGLRLGGFFFIFLMMVKDLLFNVCVI